MPATETHTPEHWARNFAAYISGLDPEGYIAELADLKRRADQADRVREAILPLVTFLRHFAADHDGDARDYFPALEAALADNQPAR